jgi:hypothetical protein
MQLLSNLSGITNIAGLVPRSVRFGLARFTAPWLISLDIDRTLVCEDSPGNISQKGHVITRHNGKTYDKTALDQVRLFLTLPSLVNKHVLLFNTGRSLPDLQRLAPLLSDFSPELVATNGGELLFVRNRSTPFPTGETARKEAIKKWFEGLDVRKAYEPYIQHVSLRSLDAEIEGEAPRYLYTTEVMKQIQQLLTPDVNGNSRIKIHTRSGLRSATIENISPANSEDQIILNLSEGNSPPLFQIQSSLEEAGFRLSYLGDGTKARKVETEAAKEERLIKEAESMCTKQADHITRVLLGFLQKKYRSYNDFKVQYRYYAAKDGRPPSCYFTVTRNNTDKSTLIRYILSELFEPGKPVAFTHAGDGANDLTSLNTTEFSNIQGHTIPHYPLQIGHENDFVNRGLTNDSERFTKVHIGELGLGLRYQWQQITQNNPSAFLPKFSSTSPNKLATNPHFSVCA